MFAEEPPALSNSSGKTRDLRNLSTAGKIQQLPRGEASRVLVFIGLVSSLSYQGYGNFFFLTLTSRLSRVMQLKALKLFSSRDLESYQQLVQRVFCLLNQACKHLAFH